MKLLDLSLAKGGKKSGLNLMLSKNLLQKNFLGLFPLPTHTKNLSFPPKRSYKILYIPRKQLGQTSKEINVS